VSEYDADELAKDSEDVKKIEKAEKAAERKACLVRKRRSHAQIPTGVISKYFWPLSRPISEVARGNQCSPNSDSS